MAAPQASSRLEMLQARFQQRQLQEKEQKLLQLYDQQQQRAYQVVQRGSAGSNGSNHGSMVTQSIVTRATSTSNTTTSQGGKVRQMFDERRQTTVKGIDRSYPLEPLENKPRKQTNVNGAGNQKNGNLTANRQSVTAKRVARADVNSNLNAGKPVVSYNEEVTRESLGPMMHHHHDDDEDLVDENHVTHYANGNYRNDHEVRIEEVLDQDTIESNRMMAKLHLMEFDDTLKHRVRNDLETEEFPEELMVEVPDRRPKRNVTKKLSQAEARLERFKNANAKRTNASKNTTSTITNVSKKRSEATPPSKSTSRVNEDTKNGKLKRRSDTGRKSPGKVDAMEAYKTSKSFARTLSSSEPGRNVERRRNDSPQLFSEESEKSAATMKIEPKTSRTSSLKSFKLEKIGKDNEFFARESKKLTTFSVKPNLVDVLGSSVLTKTDKYRERTPETLSGKPDKSARIRKIDSQTIKLSRESNRSPKLRSTSPQFFCRESEKSATTFQIDGKDSSDSNESIKRRSENPDFYVKQRSQATDLKLKRAASSSPESLKSILKDKKGTRSNIKNKWIQSESPKPFERMTTSRSPSPSIFYRESERTRTPSNTNIEYEKLKNSKIRDSSPPLQSQKYEVQDTPAIQSRTGKTDSRDRVIKNEEKSTPTPQYFCVESEKSATTMLITPETAKLARKPIKLDEKRKHPVSDIKTDLKQKRSSNIIKEKEPLKSSETRFPALKSEKTLRIIDDNAKNKKNESRKTLIKSAEMIQSPVSLKSLRSQSIRNRSSSPPFYCRESERSATTMSIDRKITGDPLAEAEKLVDKNRRPGFFCGKSERSANHMNINAKGSNVQSPKTISGIVTPPEIRPLRSHIRVHSPVSLKNIENFSERNRISSSRLLRECSEQSRKASLQLLQEYDNRSSRSPSPQLTTDFHRNASRRSPSPQLTTDFHRNPSRRSPSPQLTTDFHRNASRISPSPQLTTDFEGSRRSRSGSPQFYLKESDKSVIIDKKESPKSTSYEELLDQRKSPESCCRKSERTAGSINLKSKPDKNQSDERSKSQRFYQRKLTKDPVLSPNEKSLVSISRIRRLSKSPEYLRSTILIRDIIKSSTNDDAVGKELTARNAGIIKKDHFNKEEEIEVFQADSETNERRRTPANKHYKSVNIIKRDTGIIKYCNSDKDKEIEVFEVDNEVNERPRTPANKHYKPPTPECSPKSFTSTEVDTEVHEITMTDQFLERRVPRTKEGKTSLKKNIGKTFSKSSKEKAVDSNVLKGRNVSTYSVCKPSKKRPSLLESGVFVSPNIPKENQLSIVHRSSIEWESSNDEDDVDKSGEIDVSLKEIIQDKSKTKRSYSSSSSPTNEFECRTFKRRTRDNSITQEKHSKPTIVQSRKQAQNKKTKDKEIPGNLKVTIFDASRKKGDCFKESSSRKPIVRDLERIEENYSKIQDKQIPRSMEVVQETIKNETSETWQESPINKITKKKNNIVKKVEVKEKSKDTIGQLNKSGKVSKRGFKAVAEGIPGNRICSKNHKNVANIVAKKAKYSISTNASNEVFKNRRKAEANYEKPTQSNVALKRTNTDKTLSDKLPVSKTNASDEKTEFLAQRNVEKLAKNFEDKIVKKQEAVYRSTNEDEAKINSPKKCPRSFTATENFAAAEDSTKKFANLGGRNDSSVTSVTKSSDAASSSAINLNTMKINEITGSRTKSFDAKNEGILKKDYERTASVESALKRFDSIGKEFEYQETNTYSTKSFDRDLSTQILSDLKKESTKNERNGMKSIKQDNIKISKNASFLNKGTPKMSKVLDVPSKKRSMKDIKSMKIGRITAKKISPSCKRRLFQDSDSAEEKITVSPKAKYNLNIIKNTECVSSPDFKSDKHVTSQTFDFSKSISNERIEKTTGKVSGKLADEKSAEILDSDKSLAVKQLRSIEDIRKSLKNESFEQVQSSGSIIFRVKESESKSAIANGRSKLSESRKAKKQCESDVGDGFMKKKEMPLADRTKNLSSKNNGRQGSGKLCSNATMPLSRIVKSPSPDRGVKKTETSGRARTNVLLSPSKSPDGGGRRSSDLKGQDAKSFRRAATTRNTEPTGSGKTTINTKKSIDVVDGPVHQNGEHFGDRVAEAKYNNDLPITKKSDAFVIELDEQPSKEKEVAPSKKPLLRKQSSERQTPSTQSGRPPSSGSSISSGNSMHSKNKMAARAKTPLTNSSPSKFSTSSKSGGNLAASDNLVSCKICGRRFAQDRISLHEQICLKAAQKKRKQFDAMLHRVQGTELEPFVKKGLPKKQSESKSKKPEVKSNWRRKHEDFINAIRSAKQVQAHLAAGGKLSDLPPPPASDTSDYIQCPHCGRKFNQSAAERHIPKCQNMMHNKPAHTRAPKPKR